MVVTKTVSASGIVYNTNCNVHSVAISKAGGAGTVTIYDNTAASGTAPFVLDGNTVMAYPSGNFAGGGSEFQTGIYVSISAGTPEVMVTYEP